MPHVAGLNPRAYRAGNRAPSRRASPRVVDGTLLRCFAALEAPAQEKLAHQIGTTPQQLLADVVAERRCRPLLTNT